VDRARDQLLARAALALDQHRQVGLDQPVELLEDAPHRVRGAHDRGVVVAPALDGQLLAHDGQLGVAVAHLAAELLVQHLDLAPRLLQALRALAQLLHAPRVADRDRGLVGVELEQLEVGLAERVLLHAVVHVEHALDARLDLDRQAHHRAQAQVLDAGHAAEALVARGVHREQALAGLEAVVGDPQREARARDRDVGAVEAARQAHVQALQVAGLALGGARGEQQEAALALHQRQGRVDDQAQQRGELGLARQLARRAREDEQVVALGARLAGQRAQARRRLLLGPDLGVELLEHDAHAAHLQPVAGREAPAVDAHAVDLRAVGRAEVGQPDALGPALDAAVVARYLCAVEADVVVERTPDGQQLALELQLGARPFLVDGEQHAVLCPRTDPGSVSWKSRVGGAGAPSCV
jgi:hypothetical protein